MKETGWLYRKKIAKWVFLALFSLNFSVLADQLSFLEKSTTTINTCTAYFNTFLNNKQFLITSKCIHSPFKMSITPIQWVSPGKSSDYVLTIQNDDSLTCKPATIHLTAKPNTIWITAHLDKTPLIISPGSSVIVHLDTTVSVAAPPAIYGVNIRGLNRDAIPEFLTIDTALGVLPH